MPALIKTTGKSGLYIMLLLGRQMTYAHSPVRDALRAARHRPASRYRHDAAHDQQAREVYVDAFRTAPGS
jgi:hypothetical protein